MGMWHEDVVGSDLRLPGIKVHVREGVAEFIENRDGQFLFVCSHCTGTIWYRPCDDFTLPTPECGPAFIEHRKRLHATVFGEGVHP